MSSAPTGLAVVPPRHSRLGALLADPVAGGQPWQLAHLCCTVIALVHLPALFGAVVGVSVPARVSALTAVGALLAAQLRFASRRARAGLLAYCLGASVALAQASLADSWVAALAAVLAFLGIGLYRSVPCWALGVVSAVSAALYEPVRAMTLLAAAALAGMVLAALAIVREQTRSAQHSLRITRELLGVAGEVVLTADTMTEAAGTLLDILCDPRQWVAGHLFVRRGDQFVDSGLWNALAHRSHPELVRDFGNDLAAVGTAASVLSLAMTQSSSPVWLSTGSATPGFRNLEAAVTPQRAEVLRRHGIGTMLIAPVVVGGQVTALIELLSPRPIWREPEELQTLALVATLLARAGERDLARIALDEQHALLRAMELGVPDSVLVYDVRSGVVLHTSPGAAHLWEPADVLGRPVSAVIESSPMDWGGQEVEAFLAQLSPTAPTRVLLPGRDRQAPPSAGAGPAGAVAPAEVYRAVSRIGGRDTAFLFLRDVSDREQAQAALAAAAARTEALLAVSGSGLFEVDNDGLVAHVNPEGARLLGLTPADVLGRPMATLVPAVAADIDALSHPATPHSSVTSGAELGPVRHAWLAAADRDPIPVTATVATGGPQGRAIVTVTDATQLERAARLQERHQYALEFNDTVTQGLTVALYALEENEQDLAAAALTSTLASAKQTVRTLLLDAATLGPGQLRRSSPARVDAPVGPGLDDLVVGGTRSSDALALEVAHANRTGEEPL